jgi:hypothetical protein
MSKQFCYTISNRAGSVEAWYPSAEMAKQEAHKAAYEIGIYEIPPLRKHWWQWWLPREHTEIDQWVLDTVKVKDE